MEYNRKAQVDSYGTDPMDSPVFYHGPKVAGLKTPKKPIITFFL